MEDVVDTGNGARGHRGIRQIALDELGAIAGSGEVLPLAGDEAVGDAHGLALADERFRQMRSDEAGPAGDEPSRHDQLCLEAVAESATGKSPAGRPGTIFKAFP